MHEDSFDVAPLVRAGGRRACGAVENVPADRIRHIESLICTQQDTKNAAALCTDKFPDARCDPIRRTGWTRISVERSEIEARFLRDKSVVTTADGGSRTAKTGVQ